MNLYKIKTRTVQDRVSFTLEELTEALCKFKPKEIFNTHYSDKVPCWFITEYLGDNKIKYYAHNSDRIPQERTIESFYDSIKYQGLDGCYFNPNTIDFGMHFISVLDKKPGHK